MMRPKRTFFATFCLVVCLLVLIPVSCNKNGQENTDNSLSIMTFNAYSEGLDAIDGTATLQPWSERKKAILKMFHSVHPTFATLQECPKGLAKKIASYYYGVVSAEKQIDLEGNEYGNVILYKKSLYKLIENGAFQVVSTNIATQENYTATINWCSISKKMDGKSCMIFNISLPRVKLVALPKDEFNFIYQDIMAKAAKEIQYIRDIRIGSVEMSIIPVFLCGNFIGPILNKSYEALGNIGFGSANNLSSRSICIKTKHCFNEEDKFNGEFMWADIFAHSVICNECFPITQNYGVDYISGIYPFFLKFTCVTKDPFYIEQGNY